MHGSRRYLTLSALLLAAILLLAINVLSNAVFPRARIDLTENKLYTLSVGTRSILKSLKEPIHLRLFLSAEQATRLPGISSYTQRVSELLRQYERESGGKVTLSFIDPEPFSEQEDRAVGFGLRGVSLDEGDAVFYFGLVGTSSTDAQEVIPFFSPNREEFLEHDVTKLIYQLDHPKQKVVGLLSSLPLEGGMPVPGQATPSWVVLDQIRQLFEVRSLDPNVADIPADVNVLMIVHPKNLGDQTLYAIDQFVLRGGHVLVFVDPNAESDTGGRAMMGAAPSASDLPRLFEKWGVELVKNKIAADIRFAERVRYNQESRSVVSEYPVWMNLQPDQFSTGDTVTAKLSNLFFATPGALRQRPGTSGVTYTPLVQTSKDAMLMDASLMRFLQDPSELLRQYKPGGERLALAVRITGNVKSAFPGGRPAAAEKSGADKASATDARPDETGKERQLHLDQSNAPANLIIVADADLLNDQFWARTQNFMGSRIVVPTAANGNFVINALESLVGSNDLISVRSRGQYRRPFTRVAEIQQDAELSFRQKEQELLNQLNATEQKLVELEKSKQAGDAPILNEEQTRELGRFRQEKVRIRKELRDVRHQLHKNIASLESWTKFMNIGFMPLLIGIGGVLLGIQRNRARNRRYSGQ